MKKQLQVELSFLILIFSLSILKAQINTGIYPKSFQEKTALKYEETKVAPLSAEWISAELAKPIDKGEMMKTARLLPVDISITNSGTWNRLADGTQVWQLAISSEKAKALALHFDKFKLSEGAQLFVYNQDRSLIFGPYTANDNSENGFSIGLLTGASVVLEYYNAKMPENENFIDEFHLARISYVYRSEGLFKSQYKGYGESQVCEVNVNCSEGDNWRIQQKGVARIYLVNLDSNLA